MTCAAGNSVSFATGSSEEHEALHENGGAWTLWHWRGGGTPWSRVVDLEVARAWLLRNEQFDALALIEDGPGTESLPDPSASVSGASRLRVARVYDARSEHDGQRLLVDRLWPRGIGRDSGQFDRWLKEVAPSTELRRWYGHQPERLAEFSSRYREELSEGEPARHLGALVESARSGPVTLVTATKVLSLSAARVLAEAVGEHLSR